MTLSDFAILYVSVLATMLACRCIPLFVLKGRELSSRLTQALGLIPAAAFAARVGAYAATGEGAQNSYPTAEQLAAWTP